MVNAPKLVGCNLPMSSFSERCRILQCSKFVHRNCVGYGETQGAVCVQAVPLVFCHLLLLRESFGFSIHDGKRADSKELIPDTADPGDEASVSFLSGSFDGLPHCLVVLGFSSNETF